MTPVSGWHPDEEDLVNGYYDGLDGRLKLHVDGCAECRALYRTICEALDAASGEGAPERGAGYGREVWARVLPQLGFEDHAQDGHFGAARVSSLIGGTRRALCGFKSPQGAWPRRWLLGTVAAGLMTFAFTAGVFTEQSIKSREPATIPAVTALNVSQPKAEAARQSQSVSLPSVYKTTKVRFAARPEAVKQLHEVDQDLKLSALNGLMQKDVKAALPGMLDVIKGDGPEKTKHNALVVLAQSDTPEARHALLDLARQSSNPALQVTAVRTIGLVGSDGARRDLAGLYTSASEVTLRHEILNSLTLSGTSPMPLEDAKTLLAVLKHEKGSVLMELYKSETDEQVRVIVLNALVAQRDGAALEELEREEKDLRMRAEISRKVEELR